MVMVIRKDREPGLWSLQWVTITGIQLNISVSVSVCPKMSVYVNQKIFLLEP